MVSLFRFFLVSLVFTLGTTTEGHAASFDCSKASTETEIAICNDPELSAFDDRLSDVYIRARLVTENVSGDSIKIKNNQIAWLNKRNLCGSEIGCLQNAYQTRIEELIEYDYVQLFKLSELEKQICEDQSKPGFDSGITQKMLEAGEQYNHCLEKIILNLVDSTTFSDGQLISNYLETLRNSYQFIIDTVYSSRIECSPSCGSMYRLYPSAMYSGILEKLITIVSDAQFE